MTGKQQRSRSSLTDQNHVRSVKMLLLDQTRVGPPANEQFFPAFDRLFDGLVFLENSSHLSFLSFSPSLLSLSLSLFLSFLPFLPFLLSSLLFSFPVDPLFKIFKYWTLKQIGLFSQHHVPIEKRMFTKLREVEEVDLYMFLIFDF
jgi:hypothetical protein